MPEKIKCCHYPAVGYNAVENTGQEIGCTVDCKIESLAFAGNDLAGMVERRTVGNKVLEVALEVEVGQRLS